jgi:hypothetical protein
VDRCALFVDAGYVLGDGALAVHGTRNRESVSWDYAGVLQVLKNVARDRTGLPLLRCYWYEATVEGRRSSEHETLADLPGVKLRLGKMKPGRREGVESEIHRDLTTLARNRAISDALVVSAEEDLAQVIADVQDLGLRVILVHIAAPGCTAAAVLRQECDDIVEISGAHLRPSVELVAGAEPVTDGERQVAGAYANRAPANGHGPHGVIGQPAPPANAAAPAIYTGSVIAQYQRAAQPGNSPRPAMSDAAGPAGNSLAAPRAQPAGPAQPGITPPAGAVGQPAVPGQPGTGQGSPTGPGDLTGPPTLPTAPAHSPAPAPPPPAPAVSQPGVAGQPAASQPGAPAGLTGAPAVPGHHAATPGHHAMPGQHSAAPGHHAAPGAPLAQPGPAHVPGPLAAPSGAPQRAQALPRAGQHASPAPAAPESGPVAHGPHLQPGLPTEPIPPGQPTPPPAMPGQQVPGPRLVPGQPVAQGFQAPAGPPGPQSRQGGPAYQAAPPPAPPPPAPAPQGAPARPAAPQGLPAQVPDMAGGQAPAAPRPPTAGAPPGPVPPAAPTAAGVPALSAVRPGAQARSAPGGYPAASPAAPGDQRAGQYPISPGRPEAGPYVPPQGPHSGPQPAAQHALLVPQPVPVSLADAVQAAHGEGVNFGHGVAREAPALWLEAVLARKPRMPSDLEARLLQDSSLPIDSLLHDEVRHALRRGFWDGLERARH